MCSSECATVKLRSIICLHRHFRVEVIRSKTTSGYHLYRKPGNSGRIQMEKFIPVEIFRMKGNTIRGITFFPFLPKRPKFSVPFVWITSARLKVERKRKIYRYIVNGKTQSRSCFRCQKNYQYHLTEMFHRSFPTNCKRSIKQ